MPFLQPRNGPIYVPSYGAPVVKYIVRSIYAVAETTSFIVRYLVGPVSRWSVVLFVGSMLGTFILGLYSGRAFRKTWRQSVYRVRRFDWCLISLLWDSILLAFSVLCSLVH